MDEKESKGLLSATESRMRHMQRREESRRKQEIFEKENANVIGLLSNKNITNQRFNFNDRKKRNGIKSNTKNEEIHLECGHYFHSFCIRGWIMIGKRNVCPICQEKVEMSGIFANPWHKQDRMWSQLLDAIRYLLVWNPIICMIASMTFNISGMKMQENVTHEYTVYEYQIGTNSPNTVHAN